jgi:UDP-glucose:(heptosyl)LPS alpha-1,3-glucosyltransferase
MALLRSRSPKKPFYLIVVGKEKGWARRLAKKLGVNEQVRFTGPKEPDTYYGASDIFVLPTFFDPCANVTFEALACGLPVLTSAQNGAYDRLTPGENGFYIEDAADATTLAGFWEHFFDRGKLAEASESARKLALSHTVDDMFDELMEVLARTHQNQTGS